MTALTPWLEPGAAEAEVIAGARALLVRDLIAALELYSDLCSGVIHPGSVWDDLEHEDDGYSIALERAAEGVRDGSEALRDALPSLDTSTKGEAA